MTNLVEEASVQRAGYQRCMNNMEGRHVPDVRMLLKAAIFKNAQVNSLLVHRIILRITHGLLLMPNGNFLITFVAICLIVIFYMICIVDCKWGDWVIVECSKTCGSGFQIDSRQKLQEELFGGKPCEGNSTRQRECNTDKCPGI